MRRLTLSPRPRRRGLAGLAALAGVVMMVAASGRASAQLSPTLKGTVDVPAEGKTLDVPGATVSGTFEYGQNALGGDEGKVTKVVITLIPDRGQELPADSSAEFTGSTRTLPFSWSSPRFTWNGPYTARVEGFGTPLLGGPQTTSILRHFALALPPAKPTGVTATKGANGVTVSWDENPEPDVVLYEVLRAGAGEGFTTVAQTTRDLTTLTDTPPFGNWRYTVVAIRLGAGDEGITSSGSQEATIALPPPPTAGDGPGTGADGTSTGAGAGSGSALSPGAPNASVRSGTVDLSGFGALLDGRKPSTTTSGGQRLNPSDDGFAETLPFVPGDESTIASDIELGADEDTTQQAQSVDNSELSSDGSDRRRSLSFVATGLLMFVLAMGMIFVKGEVKRADELEALDPRPFPKPDPYATIAGLAQLDGDSERLPIRSGPLRPRPNLPESGRPVNGRPVGRGWSTPPPLEAPGLDVPQSVSAGPGEP